MKLEDILKTLPDVEKSSFLETAQEYLDSLKREKGQQNFLDFVRSMWPGFIDGAHHKIMAKKFEEIANGTCKRLIINMPPRHTKSEFASYMLPAWFLGRYPGKKIIQTSNTAELAVGFGRKVRNLVGSEAYQSIFPDVGLQADSKAAGRWATNQGGDYFAIGVGGTVTGKGADLLIIDDPHSEQEAAIAASNPEVYDKVYEWYSSGPRQRLQPGGAIVVVMCMTGDTPVLMANGLEKPLRDIRQGDIVATFEKGRLTTAKVNNWQSSGVDIIYKIQTQSGKILRANERHPFLIDNEGVLEWTRIKYLRVGDELVSLKDATDLQGHKQSLENAEHANLKKITTAGILKRLTDRLGITANGKVKHAHNQNVNSQFTVTDFAKSITEKIIGLLAVAEKAQNKEERTALKAGTVSRLSNITLWLQNVIIGAMSAASLLPKKILAHIGMESYVLTTATTQARSGGFYATTATSPLHTQKPLKTRSQLHLISDFTTDPIASITVDGQEEVFDVEVDRTENFIANGIVSHNTRWSKRDLTGRILQSAIDREGDKWEIISFPAILPSGRSLWPAFWKLEELQALKEELPVSKWNAQYQQEPTSEEGALVKREWWRKWEQDRPPQCDFVIQSWDTAFTKNERSDYSACTTWGVFYRDEDPNDANIILLDAFKERLEFPELKAKAMEYYKEWEPDAFIVEAKAAGSPLIFELRRMGIPVSEFTPTRGNDKIARLNAVTDLFASGKIWAPDRRWAEEVIEEMAAFPNSEHDDLTDSSTQALLRFRKGGFVRVDSDYEDQPTYRKKAAYY